MRALLGVAEFALSLGRLELGLHLGHLLDFLLMKFLYATVPSCLNILF